MWTVAFAARKEAAHSAETPSSIVSLFSCFRDYELGVIGSSDQSSGKISQGLLGEPGKFSQAHLVLPAAALPRIQLGFRGVGLYRGTSLIRNRTPPRTSIGTWLSQPPRVLVYLSPPASG